MSDRRYVEVPGSETHELPPLFVRGAAVEEGMDDVIAMASDIVDGEDLLLQSPPAAPALEQRRFDLALQLAEQYRRLLGHWQWGDSVLEWIRQCEITFESQQALRHLLHCDVWPHAGRSSFVELLLEKQVPTGGVALDQAVGLRLTFRQPPPIACFSNQFLFYLNSPLADAAYHTWAALSTDPAALLPPNRFHFEVLDLDH